MRRAAVESGLLFAGILLYIWELRAPYPHFWIFLLLFVLVTLWLDGATPASLGLRRAGLRECFGRYGIPIAGVSALLVAGGWIFHTFRRISPFSVIANLLLYCLWGLLQQFLLNGYFLDRFSRFTRHPCLWAAAAFGLVHTPNWFLMLVTAAGGYAAGICWLRYRNLYFLGLAHGILGTLIYLTVPDGIIRHLYVGPRWFRT